MTKTNTVVESKKQVKAVKKTAKPLRAPAIIILGILFFCCFFVASISLGAAVLNFDTHWDAFFNSDEPVTITLLIC